MPLLLHSLLLRQRTLLLRTTRNFSPFPLLHQQPTPQFPWMSRSTTNETTTTTDDNNNIMNVHTSSTSAYSSRSSSVVGFVMHNCTAAAAATIGILTTMAVIQSTISCDDVVSVVENDDDCVRAIADGLATVTRNNTSNHNSSCHDRCRDDFFFSCLWNSPISAQHLLQSFKNTRFTHCEAISTTSTLPKSVATAVTSMTTTGTTGTTTDPGPKFNIQRQMTSIGRFALVSETKYNPSIITFVIQLQNTDHQQQFTANDLMRLWSSKQMSERHPRFHQMVRASSSYDWNDRKGRKSSSSLSFHPTSTTDISDHITESVLPCNRIQLQRVIANMQLSQWDLSHSLWHMTICNNSNKNYMSTPPIHQNHNSKTMPTFSYLTPPPLGINTGSTGESENMTTSGRSFVSSSPPTLLLFRGHHVLADGASMAAAFMDLFDEADLLRNQIVSALHQHRQRRRRKHTTILRWLWRKWVQWVQLCHGTMQAFIHMLRLLYCRIFVDQNPWKVVQQQYDKSNKNETTDRVISWSDVAFVEQVKWVAETLSDDHANSRKGFKVTINDIFISCVTAAMSKQLQYHRERMQELPSLSTNIRKKNVHSKILDEQQRFMHVAVPVHLKGGLVLPGESVGNSIGALVARVPCEMDRIEDSFNDDHEYSANNSVQRLHAVSRELNTIKRTPTALISYTMAKVLSNITTWNILPTSWMSYLYSNANAGSMVVVSNNRGPLSPVHIDGHLVESITGFVPIPPGIPVGVVVMSYAGRISCSLSAEPWAIPDGDQFMVWILEEYVQLVDAAKIKQRRS